MTFDIASSWFSYEDHGGHERASLTTSNMTADAASVSPVSFLKDRFIYRKWQSISNNDWFQFDFGASVLVQSLTLVFPRITNPYRKYETQEIAASDLIRHTLDADGQTPGVGGVFDSGNLQSRVWPTRGYHVCVLAEPVTCRFWRCEINALSRAAENFFLLGLAMAGPVFQPSFNHIYGESIGFPDNSEIQRTPTSQTAFITRNERTLFAQLQWDFAPDTDRIKFAAMDEYAGSTEPIVFSMAQKGEGEFSSVSGPNGWVCDGDKVFVGNSRTDLSLSSRELNASIKQINLTEHR